MRRIYGNDKLHDQFCQALSSCDERDRLYVYRLREGKPVDGAVYKGAPFYELEEMLRDQEGGGEFQIMIRRGKTMLLSGVISIHPPLAHAR